MAPERLSPSTPPAAPPSAARRGRDALGGVPPAVQFVEVAVDGVARLVGNGVAEQGAREARGRGGGAHRALSDAGSSPCHMRSATCRASRSALAPSGSSFA